jgi:hypothetical protein
MMDLVDGEQGGTCTICDINKKALVRRLHESGPRKIEYHIGM